MGSMSRKINYAIVGIEPGTTKMKKIEQFNTTQLTEEEFFDLVKTSETKEEQVSISFFLF